MMPTSLARKEEYREKDEALSGRHDRRLAGVDGGDLDRSVTRRNGGNSTIFVRGFPRIDVFTFLGACDRLSLLGTGVVAIVSHARFSFLSR